MTEAPVPPRQPGSALEDVLPTAIDVLGDPRGFFSSMPREGGYDAPGIFAAVMLVAYAVVVALFTLLRGLAWLCKMDLLRISPPEET